MGRSRLRICIHLRKREGLDINFVRRFSIAVFSQAKMSHAFKQVGFTVLLKQQESWKYATALSLSNERFGLLGLIHMVSLEFPKTQARTRKMAFRDWYPDFYFLEWPRLMKFQSSKATMSFITGTSTQA